PRPGYDERRRRPDRDAPRTAGQLFILLSESVRTLSTLQRFHRAALHGLFEVAVSSCVKSRRDPVKERSCDRILNDETGQTCRRSSDEHDRHDSSESVQLVEVKKLGHGRASWNDFHVPSSTPTTTTPALRKFSS